MRKHAGAVFDLRQWFAQQQIATAAAAYFSRRLAAEEAAACRLAMRNRTLSILTAGGGSL